MGTGITPPLEPHHAKVRRLALRRAACWISSACLALVLVSVAKSEEFVPGESYFGRNQYVEYVAGNLPVVLSAPHGGRIKASEIPDRAAGTFAFDRNTQEAARAIAAEFQARTGGWPHVVICRLHRTKLDCNRDIPEAAAGNPYAEQAWHEYQGYLERARQTVAQQHGRGLFIDLHGHGHKPQRLELGYLHTQLELQKPDATFDDPRVGAEGSLRAIAALNRLPYSQLLRGPLSFGALMEKHGFPCTPSPTTPHPPLPYFKGGYNTQRHGRDAVPLAGLQIETNYAGVRDTAVNRERFAKAIVASVEQYIETHLGVLVKPFKSQPPTALPAERPAPAVQIAVHTPVAAPYCPPPRRNCRLFHRRGRLCRG